MVRRKLPAEAARTLFDDGAPRPMVDPRRLVRALRLDVVPDGPRAFRVTGGRDPHRVTVTPDGWECDCRDRAFRPRVACAHLLAAFLTLRLPRPIRVALRATQGRP